MLLTKQDKQILYKLYSEYLNRRKTGLSISESSNFVSGRSVHENFFPEMSYEDIDHSLRQLGKNNYLKNTTTKSIIVFFQMMQLLTWKIFPKKLFYL